MSQPTPSITRPGREGRMTPAEVEAFLQRPLIGHLACRDADGWPYVIPTWFEWDGAGFWIIPRAKSVWAAHLHADPRAALAIDDAQTGGRVVCQGSADLLETPNVDGRWVEIGERMAVRYRGEAGRAYLQATLDQPRWLFHLRPRRLITWKAAGWHERYAR